MFKNLEYYKPNLEKTIVTMQKAYDDAHARKGGNVTVLSMSPDMHVGGALDLTKYNGFESDEDIQRYIKDTVELFEKTMEQRKDIDDNLIPSVSINIGIGDFSAFVTGEIIFKPDTSWSPHPLEGKPISDYKKFPELGTAKWYKRYLYMAEELIKIAAPAGIPFSRAYFSPHDMVHALRGNDVYFDYYDHVEEIKELLDYCADAIIKFGDDILELMKKYYQDTKYGMFLMDGYVNMSEDGACMISPEQYREFGAPYAQKVINHFGRGQMHCHSRAMYLVKEICSLDNVVSLWLATDPNQPKPIEHIDEIVEDANGVFLAIDAEKPEEITSQIDKLKKGNFSIYFPSENKDKAKKSIDYINSLL